MSRPWKLLRHKKQATYQEVGDMSCIYVYVRPKEKFPPGEDIFTESRKTEIALDYERGTGKLLGVEIITGTAALHVTEV